MKKIKILLPILASTTIIPSVVAASSCSSLDDLLSLKNMKAEAVSTINGQASDAMARQPEIAHKINEACKFAIGIVQKCTHPYQAYGSKKYGQAMDAMARQPEMYDDLFRAIEITGKIILSQPNEKGYALGIAMGQVYDAMARQPEIAQMLFAQYLEFAYNLINGK